MQKGQQCVYNLSASRQFVRFLNCLPFWDWHFMQNRHYKWNVQHTSSRVVQVYRHDGCAMICHLTAQLWHVGLPLPPYSKLQLSLLHLCNTNIRWLMTTLTSLRAAHKWFLCTMKKSQAFSVRQHNRCSVRFDLSVCLSVWKSPAVELFGTVDRNNKWDRKRKFMLFRPYSLSSENKGEHFVKRESSIDQVYKR